MMNAILFAKGEGLIITLGVIGIAVLLLLLAIFLLIQKQYKRCPSNRVLVIYGRTAKGGASRTIHGGAAFVMPLIQDYAYLSLEPIQIEIPLRGALSSENIRVNVPSVFTVAIGTETASDAAGAVRLLGPERFRRFASRPRRSSSVSCVK
jgi:flotillin